MINRRAGTRAALRPRDDRGSTLIEVLVATVIMGSAIMVMVAGMGTLFSTSIQNRQATTASVVARSYAEALEIAVAQSGAWCSPSYTVLAPVVPDYAVTATYGPCPANTPTTPQFQTVTIFTTPTNGTTELLRMVVHEP